MQLPALGQLFREGSQHDVLQQHGGVVASSLQVLEIRSRNRLEKRRGVGPEALLGSESRSLLLELRVILDQRKSRIKPIRGCQAI